MRYGPDYYRDDPKPIIERSLGGFKEDDIVFSVKYQATPEEFSIWEREAAVVHFDNETGLPIFVMFGNEVGKLVSDVFKSYLEQEYHEKKNTNGVDYKKIVDQEFVSPVKNRLKNPIVKEQKQSKAVKVLRTFPVVKDTGNTRYRSIYDGNMIMGKDTVKTYLIVTDTIK